MIKVTKVPGGSLLTSGRSDPPVHVFDHEDVLRGLHAVAERYGVSAQDLATNELALTVALAREPELQFENEKKRTTKPTVWTHTKLWRLWFDVESVMHQNLGMSVEWAVRRVSKLSHWDGMAVTRERFYEARRHPFGAMSIKMAERLGFEKVAEILSDMDWGSLP